MGELIYTDGKKTFYATNAFKKNEIRSEVKIRPDELTSKSIVLQHKLNVNEKEKTSRLLLDFYSSYVLGFYTLLGRSSGAFFNRPMKLWDITATLPIAKNLGMRFVDLESGKNVEQLSEDMVDENWYFRTTYLLCKNSDFDSLKVIYGGK
jgi:fructose-1,6-bisphosphatase/inositol monophosphatase family enzyme